MEAHELVFKRYGNTHRSARLVYLEIGVLDDAHGPAVIFDMSSMFECRSLALLELYLSFSGDSVIDGTGKLGRVTVLTVT